MYAALWKRFIAYMLRLEMQSTSALEHTGTTLSCSLEELLESIVEELHRHENAGENDPSRQLSRFLFFRKRPLILYKQHIEALSHSIHDFIAIHAWRSKDRRFQHPLEYRQTSAAAIWCCRVLLFMDIHSHHAIFLVILLRECCQPDALSGGRISACKAIWQETLQYMMANNSYSPMGELITSHSFAKALGNSDSPRHQAHGSFETSTSQ